MDESADWMGYALLSSREPPYRTLSGTVWTQDAGFSDFAENVEVVRV
jgi:hypothetical protein